MWGISMEHDQKARESIVRQMDRLAQASEQASLQSEIVETECRRTIAMSKTANRILEVTRLLEKAEKARRDLLIGSKILPECLEK